MTKKKKISVVVPCFNEAESLDVFFEKITEVLESRSEFKYEIIFIDDGSFDSTPAILSKIECLDPSVRVLSLSRNFGHQIAVTAGLDHAVGDAVVLIDADLQDPPEVILEMLEKWEDGCQVAYGVRTERAGETRFKLFTAKVFYRLINKLSDVDIPLDTGDFRLMDRLVVDALKNMPEKDRFIRGMVAWVGLKQEPVFYERDKRFAGSTNYPFTKMVNFALDAMLSFSIRPLQFATLIGFLIACGSILGIFYSIIMRLFGDAWVPGWTLLFIATLFLGGVQLMFLGLIGEYLGRVYGEVKRRPLYLLKNADKKDY